MQTFAGSEGVPVVSQALAILSTLGVPVLNDENIDTIPPDAIVIAACSSNARLPSRFLRRLPADLGARRLELAARSFKIPEQVLDIPRLVLIRPNTCGDGRYVRGDDLSGLTMALRDLAGIKPVKTARNRGRNAHTRREGGLQPYLAH